MKKEEYTVESFEIFKTALAEANNITDNVDVIQADADVALSNLIQAFEGLEKVTA